MHLVPISILEDQFVEWLQNYHLGKANAITSKQMRQWGNPREIRYLVKRLRSQGVPICSGQRGYYFAANSTEISEVVKFLRAQIDGIEETRSCLRDVYYRIREQELRASMSS